MIETLALFGIAVLNAFTAYMSYRAQHESYLSRLSNSNTEINVQRIETATNSMKDALVASTAKASHFEGEMKGRADMRNELSHTG